MCDVCLPYAKRLTFAGAQAALLLCAFPSGCLTLLGGGQHLTHPSMMNGSQGLNSPVFCCTFSFSFFLSSFFFFLYFKKEENVSNRNGK